MSLATFFGPRAEHTTGYCRGWGGWGRGGRVRQPWDTFLPEGTEIGVRHRGVLAPWSPPFVSLVIFRLPGPSLMTMTAMAFWNWWEDNNQSFSGKFKLVDRRLRYPPYFFRQIQRGCFGLQTASEAKSDLAIGFVLAQNPFLPSFSRMVTWEYWPCLNSLAEIHQESCKM